MGTKIWMDGSNIHYDFWISGAEITKNKLKKFEFEESSESFRLIDDKETKWNINECTKNLKSICLPCKI